HSLVELLIERDRRVLLRDLIEHDRVPGIPVRLRVDAGLLLRTVLSRQASRTENIHRLSATGNELARKVLPHRARKNSQMTQSRDRRSSSLLRGIQLVSHGEPPKRSVSYRLGSRGGTVRGMDRSAVEHSFRNLRQVRLLRLLSRTTPAPQCLRGLLRRWPLSRHNLQEALGISQHLCLGAGRETSHNLFRQASLSAHLGSEKLRPKHRQLAVLLLRRLVRLLLGLLGARTKTLQLRVLLADLLQCL